MTTEHGGEILLLAPGWTSFIVVRRIVGHLPTMCRTTMRDVQPGASKRISQPCSLVIWSMVGKFSYSTQAGLSHHHSVHGQEILLLATMRQTTTRYVQPGASKKSPHHTLNDNNRAWWGDSLTCPRLDIFHHRSSHSGASANHAPNDDERCPA